MFHHVSFQVLSAIAIISWSCSPISAILNGEEKKLPSDGWYPYDTANPLNFIFTWMHQVRKEKNHVFNIKIVLLEGIKGMIN